MELPARQQLGPCHVRVARRPNHGRARAAEGLVDVGRGGDGAGGGRAIEAHRLHLRVAQDAARAHLDRLERAVEARCVVVQAGVLGAETIHIKEHELRVAGHRERACDHRQVACREEPAGRGHGAIVLEVHACAVPHGDLEEVGETEGPDARVAGDCELHAALELLHAQARQRRVVLDRDPVGHPRGPLRSDLHLLQVLRFGYCDGFAGCGVALAGRVQPRHQQRAHVLVAVEQEDPGKVCEALEVGHPDLVRRAPVAQNPDAVCGQGACADARGLGHLDAGQPAVVLDVEVAVDGGEVRERQLAQVHDIVHKDGARDAAEERKVEGQHVEALTPRVLEDERGAQSDPHGLELRDQHRAQEVAAVDIEALAHALEHRHVDHRQVLRVLQVDLPGCGAQAREVEYELVLRPTAGGRHVDREAAAERDRLERRERHVLELRGHAGELDEPCLRELVHLHALQRHAVVEVHLVCRPRLPAAPEVHLLKIHVVPEVDGVAVGPEPRLAQQRRTDLSEAACALHDDPSPRPRQPRHPQHPAVLRASATRRDAHAVVVAVAVVAGAFEARQRDVGEVGAAGDVDVPVDTRESLELQHREVVDVLQREEARHHVELAHVHGHRLLRRAAG
eukprot:2659758-Rhodomonas_salina.2